MKLDKERALKELGIPDEMYRELVGGFAEQVTDAIKDFEKFFVAGDLEGIIRLAHFIKGSAGNLRVEEMHLLAKEIEFSAREGKSLEVIRGSLDRLKNALAELKTML